MNLTRAAATVGLACVAASLLAKRSRAAPLEADDGLEPFPSVDPGLPARLGAPTAAPAATGADGGASARSADFARGA